MTLTPRRLTVWALALTVAGAPLYVVRWHVGRYPTTLLEAFVLVTVAAYLVTLWTEHRLPAARTPYDIPIALLLVAGMISIAVAPDRSRALGIYRAYFIEAIAIFYIAVDMMRTREDLRTVLVFAAGGSALMAAGQVVSFAIVLAQHRLQLGDAPSFLNTSANAVAMYLEPPLAMALAFALFPSRPRERLVGGALFALLLVAMVLTLSRTSYLAMTVLAVVLVLSLQSARRRLWAVAVIVVIGVVVLEIPFVNHRLLDLAHSAGERTSLFRQALQMLAQRPLTGAGFDGYPVRVAPFRPSSQVVELYPHDFWLTTWSETGLLGLLAFIAIFFGLLWRGWGAIARATDIYKPVIWGTSGALVLYLVHGLFDSPYWKNDLSVEFWALAALQVVAIRATRGSGHGAKRAAP